MNEHWYTVKGLFRWYFKSDGKTHLYEERVVLFKATNFDEALNKAEIEAIEYCEEDKEANFMVENLNRFTAHKILDKLDEGVELLSSRKESNLNKMEYIEKYYVSNDS